MTTIVFDGEIIAADGRYTSNDIVIQDDAKKIHYLGGNVQYKRDPIFYVAGCGPSSLCDKAVELIFESEFDKLPESYQYSIMVIGKYNNYWVTNGHMEINTCNKWAIGTGSPFALSALELGLDAVAAVEHACKFDIYSGGIITKAKVIY